MFFKSNKPHLLGKLHVFLAFFMVMAVVMGTQPADIAQADNTIDTDGPNQHQNESFLDVKDDSDWRTPPPGFESEPAKNDVYPFSYMDTKPPQTSYSPPLIDEGDVFYSEKGIKVGSDGTLPLPSSSGGGSLPAGFDTRSVGPGIYVDLTYDVVMGDLDGRDGELVTVTMGADGYGAAVVDDTGFFWTSIWHTTGGYSMDLDCGMTISVVVGSDAAVVINPPCITGGIDLSTNTIHGQVAGDPGGNYVWPHIGYFDPVSMQPRTVTGSYSASGIITESDGFGSFSQTLFITDLGAESLYTIDYELDEDIYIRTFFYPDTPVFMIQQYSSIAGYADVGQTVTASVIDMNSATVVWSDTTIADWPHGFYDFRDVPIEVGNSVEVVLDGGPTLQTFAVALGNLVFDATADTLSGTAPDGVAVRATTWRWSGNSHYRINFNVTATSGDTFFMDFNTGINPFDLRPRDDVLVVVEDPSGNQVQILSGPPFTRANISLDSNIDCVSGRLDGPDLPIVITLDKGAGEVYTRDTGSLTDVGNYILPPLWCFVIMDGEDNFVDFAPGDIVTLKDGTPGWEGSVEVVDFTWSGDTSNNYINGTTAEGDVEVTVSQWQGELYPTNGVSSGQSPVSGGSFSRQFVVMDIRDSVMIDFSHYNPTTGFSTKTNPFGYQPTLPYFELQLPFGVSGMAGSPGETVTARLYDGATLLAETSDDGDDDPYRYWLDDFDGHPLSPGYRMEVSTSGGWTGDMVIPSLSIEGDVDTDMLTATGPDGLLYLEVNNNNEEFPDGVAGFVPGSPAKWDVSYSGWDLVPSDWVSVTYQALDGNRAYYGVSLAEVSEVNLWLSYGVHDWMWGNAEPGSTVTAERDSITLFTAFADPACGGCWGHDDPLDINPGDVITLTAGAGIYPVTVEIPDPLTADADAATDVVSGQIGGWIEDTLEILGNWEDGYQEVTTDTGGNYASDPYGDIPEGGDGYVRFSNMSNWADVIYRQYFREPSLLLEVNYGHDWIQGYYAPGYTVLLAVFESDGTTLKATAEVITGDLPWGDGQTGFTTDIGDPWDPERPDIQPGDWVYGLVDNGYDGWVRVGTITGEVDLDLDKINGTVDAPWLIITEPVTLVCYPWGGPEGVEPKDLIVLPDGSEVYNCSWSGEWNIQPMETVAVSYLDPGGYPDPDGGQVHEGHWIYDAYYGVSDELIMRIHYDHNWIEGNYEPGHDIHLTVYDSGMAEKAHITVPTGPIPEWEGNSGFATYFEEEAWVPEMPDIEPGDVIHGEVDDGSEFTADVQVGLINGTPDVDFDRIDGTVNVDWLMPGPVDVACSIWEPDGREVYDTVAPDGADPYECVFDGDNAYDIVPGTNLMVSYFEPDGHQVIGDFSPPAPYLLIEKWFIGESPGVGGNAAFVVRYKNQGTSPAENVEIFDTMVGMTYLSDSSGFSISGVPGDSIVTWDLGTVDPGDDWNYFVVFGVVTGVLDGDISNTVEISTTNPFDQGEPWEKVGNWEGLIAANDTHLSVGKWPWTEYPAAGQPFVYSVNVCNDGSTSSSTVSLQETLPSNTLLDHWWSEDVGWYENTAGSHNLDLKHDCISSWSCSEVYIMVNVDPAAQPGDGLYNIAEITAANDMETGDNTADYYHEVGEDYVDLGIWQDFHWGILVPGGYYRYGITFRNEGNVLVSGPIEVTATLPSGTSFAGWDSWDAAGSLTDLDLDIDGNEYTWTLGDLFPGSQGTIEVWMDILPGTGPGTPLDHLAEIDDVGEPYLENNTHTLSEMVYDHGPNLRIHKYGWVEGDHIGYHLYVHNVGDEMVEDIWIYDYYSEFLDLDGGVENVHSNYEGFWEVFDHPAPIGVPPHPEKSQLTIHLDELRPTWGADIWYTMVIPAPEDGMMIENFAEIHPTTGDVWPEDNFTSFMIGEGLQMNYLPLFVH